MFLSVSIEKAQFLEFFTQSDAQSEASFAVGSNSPLQCPCIDLLGSFDGFDHHHDYTCAKSHCK
jgi:hypothetical protein